MYICICNGITDQDIIEASKTATSSLEIMKVLGVASDCGRCLQTAIDKCLEVTSVTPEAAKHTSRRVNQS
ncbi:MAG: (2Fe-2S)-binding protein [Bacteriovoracaceae bacterium]|nr:(2Fe-2S)-binding protein [Bacteriovoracaceae bacterium]